jgi:hypothetical protein
VDTIFEDNSATYGDDVLVEQGAFLQIAEASLGSNSGGMLYDEIYMVAGATITKGCKPGEAGRSFPAGASIRATEERQTETPRTPPSGTESATNSTGLQTNTLFLRSSHRALKSWRSDRATPTLAASSKPSRRGSPAP